ncbi:hypothetical protein ACSV4D_00445 [Flavobacterium sp. ARAG 55.4]|uniref:Cytochrome C and Quinol oxidase polypeptide I n=1 Tax=Flavobacterium plantiphilum TaxID=3163297 RepID=A0ABW8XRA4_9FLAO
MNLAINKPHHFFFLIIPLILAFSYYKPKNTFDINIGDTYFVILNLHLGILLAVFYFLLGLIYFCLDKKGIQLNQWITYTHTILTIGGLILIWLLLKRINNNPTKNFEEILKSIKINQYLTYICVTTLFGMIFSQIVFVVSIILKVIKV